MSPREAATGGGPRRTSRSRRLVLEALNRRHAPVSAEMLASELPDVHVSSVYRALNALEDEGVVSHVHLGHGPAVYQLSTEAGAVRHLVCERCGRHVVVPASVFASLRRRLARDYGFVLDADHFAVVGRCVACSSGSDPTGSAEGQ